MSEGSKNRHRITNVLVKKTPMPVRKPKGTAITSTPSEPESRVKSSRAIHRSEVGLTTDHNQGTAKGLSASKARGSNGTILR